MTRLFNLAAGMGLLSSRCAGLGRAHTGDLQKRRYTNFATAPPHVVRQKLIRELALLAESQEDAIARYGVFWWPESIHKATKGTMNMAVAQFQRVALTQDVVEHRLCAGDVAYVTDFVPHPSGGEPGFVMEVFNALGDSPAVVAVPLSAVEPLAADEVFTVRRLAESRE